GLYTLLSHAIGIQSHKDSTRLNVIQILHAVTTLLSQATLPANIKELSKAVADQKLELEEHQITISKGPHSLRRSGL
ncbi:hypothetical protein FBU30_002074, partial [Linnemannia zychae]